MTIFSQFDIQMMPNGNLIWLVVDKLIPIMEMLSMVECNGVILSMQPSQLQHYLNITYSNIVPRVRFTAGAGYHHYNALCAMCYGYSMGVMIAWIIDIHPCYDCMSSNPCDVMICTIGKCLHDILVRFDYQPVI